MEGFARAPIASISKLVNHEGDDGRATHEPQAWTQPPSRTRARPMGNFGGMEQQTRPQDGRDPFKKWRPLCAQRVSP